MYTHQSLRFRLPLLISVLLAVVVGALSWSWYHRLEQVLTDTAAERLTSSTRQLTGMLAPSVAPALAGARRLAADAAYARALADPAPASLGAARLALEEAVRAGASTGVTPALWDRGGTRVLAAGPLTAALPSTPHAGLLAAADSGAADAWVTPFVATDSGVVYGVVVPVLGAAGDTLGVLALYREVAGAGVADIRALIGAGAEVKLGNADGSLWTDFSARVPGPATGPVPEVLTDYTAAGGDRRFGIASSLPGTPWLVWVEVDRGTVLAPARRQLVHAATIALVALAVGVLAAWLVSQRVTAPLAELTRAAGDYARGDYGRRAAVTRGDEIGRLAVSFNGMAGRVETAAQTLQAHADDLEAVNRELRESEQRYRQLVELSPDAILVHQNQHVTFANPAAASLFGAAHPSELVGRGVLDFVPPEDRAALEWSVSRSEHQQRQVSTLERRVQRLDGSIRIVERTSTPYQLGGDRDAVLTILRDVSDRKQLEERYRQAQKMEAVGQLAGGVAHDFNNLLTVVTTYGELMLEELPAAHPSREDAGEIVRAADRAGALTRQLLAFSRQQVLQPVVVDPNEVITGMERMLGRVLPANLRLPTSLDPDVGRIHVDPGQLEQVLLNLAVNARDAMPDGGTLLMETANVVLGEEDALLHAGVEPGRYVLITVSDTGIGMTPEEQSHIFEPFYTTKEPGQGTGLGLSTVYGIVRQSGGHVWVYSQPGQGSVFKLYLPRVDEPAETPTRAPDDVAEIRGTETILLAEDEEPVRQAIRRVLERVGYTVLAAASGAEALGLLASADPHVDLLLTDMMMPEMSGPELARMARARDPGLRVVYMSGYTEHAMLRSRVVGAGAGEVFVQKPFTPRTLAERVREVLDGAVERREHPIRPSTS